jgi:hypothetical protein
MPGHIYMRLEGTNLISPYLSKPQKERTFSSILGDNRYNKIIIIIIIIIISL